MKKLYTQNTTAEMMSGYKKNVVDGKMMKVNFDQNGPASQAAVG